MNKPEVDRKQNHGAGCHPDAEIEPYGTTEQTVQDGQGRFVTCERGLGKIVENLGKKIVRAWVIPPCVAGTRALQRDSKCRYKMRRRGLEQIVEIRGETVSVRDSSYHLWWG